MSFGVLVMGVSGCGKSTLAAALASHWGWPMIEADALHPAANRVKMQAGVALTEADRAPWLAAVAQALGVHEQGAVLSCSALRRSHRELLRAAAPGLRTVHLQLTPAQALQRVAGRGAAHFFPASLVDSQFAALEPPGPDEPRVLCVDATRPLAALVDAVVAWAPQPVNTCMLRS